MAVENEEMSLAVCNLLQAIVDALSGEDKREHRGKEEALVLGRRYSSVLEQVGSKAEPVTTLRWHLLHEEVAWFDFSMCVGVIKRKVA